MCQTPSAFSFLSAPLCMPPSAPVYWVLRLSYFEQNRRFVTIQCTKSAPRLKNREAAALNPTFFLHRAAHQLLPSQTLT